MHVDAGEDLGVLQDPVANVAQSRGAQNAIGEDNRAAARSGLQEFTQRSMNRISGGWDFLTASVRRPAVRIRIVGPHVPRS